MCEDVEVEELVSRTAGFSGAEVSYKSDDYSCSVESLIIQVVSLCQKAAFCALREDMSSCSVKRRHFEEALKTIFPQTSAETIKFYEEFKKRQKNVFQT